MRYIKIRKGWFKSAGAQYKWMDKYDILGVGINMLDLKNHKALLVEVEGEQYYLETPIALKFIELFKSIYPIEKLQIGIISKSVLRKLTSSDGQLSEVKEVQEEIPVAQTNTLFDEKK